MPRPGRGWSPEGFLWGTATSAHQVEGGNWNSDWWAWEHDPGSPCVEPSGDACDHYHLYPQDVALLATLGFNAYRFSLEWARIEPEEGEFSTAQLTHYRRVLETCVEHGLAAVVTFHHFTSPRWIAAKGGWASPATAASFARFCERSAAALGDLMFAACTFNEPNIVALMGYEKGVFAPGFQHRDGAARATAIFVDAHAKARAAIKSVAPAASVGLTLAMSDYQPVDGGEQVVQDIRGRSEDGFLEAARGDDFIGVQTYTRRRVGRDGELPPEDGVERTLMGYEFWPEALEATIRRAWEVTDHVPVIVTENGIAVTDDERRIEFVRRALDGVWHCLEDGIDVRGYFYWSALDNFEWAHGYGPTFGLVSVDRATQKRHPKPSARWLGALAREAVRTPSGRAGT